MFQLRKLGPLDLPPSATAQLSKKVLPSAAIARDIAFSWTADSPNGFTDAEMAVIERLTPTLALVVNAARNVATGRVLLIDGKLVEAASGKTFPVYNPATGAILMGDFPR